MFYTRLWYRCMDFSLFSLTLTSTGFHPPVFKASYLHGSERVAIWHLCRTTLPVLLYEVAMLNKSKDNAVTVVWAMA